MGNTANSNNLNVAQTRLTLQNAIRESNEMIQEEEKYLSAISLQHASSVSHTQSTDMHVHVDAHDYHEHVPPIHNNHNHLHPTLPHHHDPHHHEHSQRSHPSTSHQLHPPHMDSKHPSLEYDEYHSDSSDEAHTTYNQFMVHFEHQSAADHLEYNQHEASMLTTNLNFDGKMTPQQSAQSNTKRLSGSTFIMPIIESSKPMDDDQPYNHGHHAQHSMETIQTASSVSLQLQRERDEKRRLKMENEALRKQNELLRQQYAAQTNSPVASPVLSGLSSESMHTPLPKSPSANSKEEAYKAAVAVPVVQVASAVFSKHAPTQSMTNEVEFDEEDDDEKVDTVGVGVHGHHNNNHGSNKHVQSTTGSSSGSSGKYTKQNSNKKKKKKEKEAVCASVEQCAAVKRLSKALKVYDKHCEDAVKLYLKLEQKGYVEHLLGDYQHVLDVHLNDSQSDVHAQYEQIRERLHAKIKRGCVVESCVGIKRYSEYHEYKKTVINIESVDDAIEFYSHSMDLIHCYLLHLEYVC